MEKEVIVDGKVINLEVNYPSSRFGILQARRNLEVWVEPFIEELTAVYSSTTSLIGKYRSHIIQSFDNIETWITEFINQGAPQEPEKFPFILVGNKMDRESEREVEEEAVTEFLAKHPKIKHLQTSAKNSEGVSVTFEQVALASI